MNHESCTHNAASVEHQLKEQRLVRQGVQTGIRRTYNFVRVHNGLETMRNCEESDVLAQLLTQRLLDDLIGLIV